MGLIAAIISQLEPEDLVRASAVSRLWRDAATDEQLWQHMCTAIPLLAQLKAEAWCELSWRELFAQQRRCDDIAKRAQDERVPIGPRHELEHYRAFVGDGKLPAGCTQVTCAMIERNGLLERLDTEYEQSRLDKGRALFSELPLTPRPVAELASDLGRIKTQKYPLAPANSYLAKVEYYSEGDSSWLEAHIAKHEQNAVDFGEIDARGVRTFFGAVLQLKPSQIRKLVGEMIDKRDGYWTSSSARKAYRVTIKFCNDVLARMTATADAPSTDERDCVQQNNIRKAEATDEDDERVRLIYDDLLPSPARTRPRDLIPVNLRIPELPTLSARADYLLGLEIYSADGDAIFSTLSELDSLQECSKDTHRLISPDFDPCAWPGDRREVGEVPQVDLFLFRKQDCSRLCLAAANDQGHAYDGDYSEDTTIYNEFDIDGTGFGNAEPNDMFNRMIVKVEMRLRGHSLTELSVQLEDDEYGGFGEWIESSVDCLLQAVQSPAFASRWVAPLQSVGAVRMPSTSAADIDSNNTKKKPRLMSSPTSTSSALQLLTTTAIVRSKPPPVMTHVLMQLEVKELIYASAVCRDWRDAAAHGNSWSLIFESEPVLTELYETFRSKFSHRQLYLQQAKANALASAPFVSVATSDYQCAVEVFTPSGTLLTQVVSLDPSRGHDLETIFTLDLSKSICEVSKDTVPKVKVYLVRKHDSKRICLVDAGIDDGDAEVMWFENTYHAGKLCDPDAFRIPYLDVSIDVEQIEDEGREKLKTLKVKMDDYNGAEAEPIIVSLDGLLQMLECPGYAHCWV